MILVTQPESTFASLVNLIHRGIQGITLKTVNRVPQGFADTGSEEAWVIEMENGEKICIAPVANGNGYFLCLMTTSPLKKRFFPDSRQVYARDFAEIEAKIKELTS